MRDEKEERKKQARSNTCTYVNLCGTGRVCCPVLMQTVQSKDDLSSFAMPHLDGGDRVGQQMELDKRVQSSDSLQG